MATSVLVSAAVRWTIEGQGEGPVQEKSGEVRESRPLGLQAEVEKGLEVGPKDA